MELNEKQKQAVAAIESPNFKQFYGIFGAGGVGKTTAIKSISSRFRVVFTSPTNKAVKVLKNSGCPPEHCMTIYSFLGLVVNEATGKITIDKKGKCKSEYYDVLVIDECSMLNTEICNRLQQIGGIKIVCLGDYAQLPPPKEKQSPVFKIIGDNHIVLTEQMRQKNAHNPLLTLLSDVRKCQDESLPMVKFSDYKRQIKDVEQGLNVGVATTGSRKQWESWLLKAFDDPRGFDNLVVAYRNSRVDELNALIHNHKYPNREIFCAGENVVFQRPYKAGDLVLYDNGDIETVETVERVQEFVSIGPHRVMIDALKINGLFVTPVDRNLFNNWVNGLMNALNNPRETAGFSWGEVYLLRDRFADVRHGYCSTVHKAQGSTVDNVFIDMPDVLAMPEPPEIVNRCIYTALSRARFNAIILE